MKSRLILPIFLLVGVIAASVLRFFQYVSLIDFSTGFFFEGSEFAGILIYILMGIVAAVSVVLLIIGRKNGGTPYTVASDGMGSHATQVLGISELIAAILIFILFIGKADLSLSITFNIGLHFSNLVGVFSTQISAGLSVPGIISSGGIAVILFVSGLLQLKNIVPPAITGHIKIVAAALMFPIIAEYYENDLIMHQRSDKLIVMLAYIMLGAFFASVSRFYSRIETPNSRMRELITSVMTFIICSVHVLPKLLAYAFGGTAVKGMSEPDLIVSAGVLISGAFIATLFFTKKTKDIIPVLYEEEVSGKKEKAAKTETE